ncbi:MAG TPA: hypothetical protein VJZ71_15600 [Phycisphaerae bacterium]|nr:hypothetical protein [Phycisphaerae bacterium]
MSREEPLTIRQFCEWVILRNPSYLISACLMAVGSRLLLVGPAQPTGDVKLILVTLAVLQLYEWTVSGILFVLHRAGRSPEDRPSLLLVAAAFWTGPMVATIEMTALRPSLGVYVAAGACLIAIGELRLCLRALHIRMSSAAQIVAGSCVILLAAAAPLLKIPESNSGWNEIALFAAWWIFAAIVLGCLGVLRSSNEAVFLAITIAATTANLVGMNYGFFCHASLFYGSPLLVALSVVIFRWLSPTSSAYEVLFALATVIPGIAIFIAQQPFDPDVPVARLPPWLRDPLIAMSTIAAASWWFGYHLHRYRVLLHAGCAALALAAFRAIHGPIDVPVVIASMRVPVLMYASAVYFVAIAWMLRSRLEALAATAIQFVATYMLVQQSYADALIITFAAGWSAWIAAHLLFRRPSWWIRFAPVAFLATVPWTLDTAPELDRWIAAQLGILVIVLLVLGQLWRWTRYRTLAGFVAGGHGLAAIVDWSFSGARPNAAGLILAGFSMLALGAMVSWHKLRLLAAISKPEEVGAALKAQEFPG